MAKKKAPVKSSKSKAAKKPAGKPAAKKVAKKQVKKVKATKPKPAVKQKPKVVKKSTAVKAKKAATKKTIVTAKAKKTTAENKSKTKVSSNKTVNTASTSDAIMRNKNSYDMLRQDIIATLWRYEEIAREELMEVLQNVHGKNFISGSLDYVQGVIDELLRIDLIELFTKEDGSSLFRIRQRLSENN